MPELPEVETVVNTLLPHVQGVKVRRVRLLRADILLPVGFPLMKRLTGRTVERLSRRGKRIVFTLDDQSAFYVHLGMTGSLTVIPARARRLPHTHLILDFETCQLRFVDPRRFGGIFWMENPNVSDAELGPEPLAVSSRELLRRLGKTDRAIKSALLDQQLLAGIGNIYADEALFAAKIHPQTIASEIDASRVGVLNRAIKQVLRRAIKHRGSTLRDYRDGNGQAGNFQSRHRVYDRTGKPCATCTTPIERIVLGGRSTHFCPGCQANRRGT